MSKHTQIGIRMKENYENRSKTFLTRRTPVIIRLDGKAFHTYTKGLDKPFDEGLIEDMQSTAKYLCANIQGCKAAYTQSDEISLLLTDYDTLQTDAWFDYNVQKLTSISASLATAKFNQLRYKRHYKNIMHKKERVEMLNTFDKKHLAFFDSRAFNIPKEEVCNYFIYRQQDAERNSIQMLAQSLFSHGKPSSQMFKKNTSELQEMCFQKGHNWNDLHFSKKRGSLILKNTYINDKLINLTNNGKAPDIGDLWYQPYNTSVIFPSDKGRLLEYSVPEYAESDLDLDWCDIPIEKIRTKWEIVDTPIFSKNRIFDKLVWNKD